MAVTAVPSQTTSIQVLASNQFRKSALFENTDANRVYIICSSQAASASLFSFSLAQNENGAVPEGYGGAVQAIWAGDGTGSLMVTEY